jgi:hypothetical protein
MTTNIPTKYEHQLPKLDKLRFDRVFGYTAGLASLAGLIGAPFLINSQDLLEYVYMGFLSLLVVLLLIHSILVEKRKLHRYAQTVFHTHFAQHLVRDALANLKTLQIDDIEQTTESILDAIANAFSITCGVTCRASIIELKDDFELKVVARDSMSRIRANARSKKHLLDDNTDFTNLWYSVNGCSRYYLNNNIVKSWVNHLYKNSCFSEHAEPEVKSILGFTYVKNWPLNYKSALILPIRYISEFRPPTKKGETISNWNYYGFLCIDSLSVNSFDSRYAPELGAIYADMLYTYFSQSEHILDTITKPQDY